MKYDRLLGLGLAALLTSCGEKAAETPETESRKPAEVAVQTDGDVAPAADVKATALGGFAVSLTKGDYTGEVLQGRAESATLELTYEEELALGEIVITVAGLEGRKSKARLTLNFFGDPEVGAVESRENILGNKAASWQGQLTITPHQPGEGNWGHRIDFKELQIEFTDVGEWQKGAKGEYRMLSGKAVIKEAWETRWGDNRSSTLSKYTDAGELTFTVRELQQEL